MGDLSERARTALANADLVCCEDTRRTGLMLHNLGIDATLMRVDEHSEYDAIPRVLDALRDGRTVSLVSDAGTPGISDPGLRLVSAAIDNGFTVSAIPGPAALIMALVISGLPAQRFVFEGFLDRRGKERSSHLAFIASHPYTVVLYEAPHRLLRTLEDLAAVCGRNRRVAVCRELTKLHEEVWRGALSDAVERFTSIEPKGEFVIVVAGASPAAADTTPEQIERRLRELIATGLHTKEIARIASEEFGLAAKDIYNRVLDLTDQS
jgi:16S rRNA (cytidine1402-2'-O)-methyltransferase